jgi:hypothetical protein
MIKVANLCTVKASNRNPKLLLKRGPVFVPTAAIPTSISSGVISSEMAATANGMQFTFCEIQFHSLRMSRSVLFSRPAFELRLLSHI